MASCRSLVYLRLTNIILNRDMISSICYQNGQTLKVLKLDHYCKIEWIQLIIDNCLELSVLDLSTACLSKESIEYVTKNVTPKISKLWLTGIKSEKKCQHMIEKLKDRCSNLTEIKMSQSRGIFGTTYGIRSQSSNQKEKDDLRVMISTFRSYE